MKYEIHPEAETEQYKKVQDLLSLLGTKQEKLVAQAPHEMIATEYGVIQQKKSKLSAKERSLIVSRYNYLVSMGILREIQDEQVDNQ